MSPTSNIPDDFRRRARRFCIASAVLLAGFTPTLVDLSRYCHREDLFSYILLIPFITGFLVARRWRDLDHSFIPAPLIVAVLGIASTLFLALSFRNGGAVSSPDPGSVCFRTLSFVVCWIATAVWIFGRRFMSGLLFPAAFLIFMTPLPPVAVETLERALQHASAEVSSWFFPLANVPFYRTGLAFQLPNITIKVAPECSGIRSTLVLFITSLLAGYLYLERPWQRAVLAALVIPLGIVRNAFRIVTIGWLCTRHGPEMIDSPIHHRGGPVFFAISLLPLFVTLILFRKFGKTCGHPDPPLPNQPRDA